MDFQNLRAINERNLSSELEQRKHTENQVSLIQLQETVIKSFATLVDYLDQKVTKTQVVNQLREIGTPDALKVVDAVNNLDKTVKSQEKVDLTEITELLKSVLTEAQSIPKELPKIPEQQFVDYSEAFKSLAETVKGVEEAVKAQETTVEAPVVNVPETVVNIPETDLKPLETSIKDTSKEVVKAVKGIKIPELNTSPLEKLLKETNKTLKELIDKPTGGGGGGGSFPAVNSAGIVQPLTVDENGVLETVDAIFATRLDDTATPILYIGKAPVGSSESSAVWQIAKLDTSSGLIKTWAGNAGFTQVWSDRGSLTYQ